MIGNAYDCPQRLLTISTMMDGSLAEANPNAEVLTSTNRHPAGIAPWACLEAVIA